MTRRVLCLALALTLLGGGRASWAQDAPPSPSTQPSASSQEPETAAEAPRVPDPPPSSFAVGDPPPPVERILKARPKKIWKALLQVLAEAKVPVATSDPKAGYLKTELTFFDGRTFHDVALPPPTISRQRPIGQRMGLNQGNFLLEVQFAKEKAGTKLIVRAYIEEKAVLMTEARRIWVERFSNGKIEKFFLDRLEAALS